MPTSSSLPLLSHVFLGRLGIALVLLFVVNNLFGLLSLRLLDPSWRLSMADQLRTTALFSLIGWALICLDESNRDIYDSKLLSLRRIQKLAPLATLDFLLLI